MLSNSSSTTSNVTFNFKDGSSIVEIPIPVGCEWDQICEVISKKISLNGKVYIQRFVLMDSNNDVKSPSLNTAAKFWQFSPFFNIDLGDYFEIHTLNVQSRIPVLSSTKNNIGIVDKVNDKENLDLDLRSASFNDPSLSNTSKQNISTDELTFNDVSGKILLSPNSAANKGYKTFRVRWNADGPRETDITIGSNCSWSDIIDAITRGFFGAIKPSTLQALVLLDSDGDEMSGLITNDEKFWNVYNKKHRDEQGLVFLIHLEPPNKSAAKALALEKARDAARAKLKKRLDAEISAKAAADSKTMSTESAVAGEIPKSLLSTTQETTAVQKIAVVDLSQVPPIPSQERDQSLAVQAASYIEPPRTPMHNQRLTALTSKGGKDVDGVTPSPESVTFLPNTPFTPPKISSELFDEGHANDKQNSETVPEKKSIAEETVMPPAASSVSKPGHDVKFCLASNIRNPVLTRVSSGCSWSELVKEISTVLSIDDEAVEHLILIDEDGDEMSPKLTSADRFWKFLTRYSTVSGLMYAVHKRAASTVASPIDSNETHDVLEGVPTKAVQSEQQVSEQRDSTLSPQDTAFRKACCEGDLTSARALLSHGVDVYTKDSEGLQAMHLACISGHIEIVKWLIGLGVSIQFADNNGMTPLHHACDGMHVGLSLFLVKSGANLMTEDGAGLTPLHCICLQGLVQLVHLLRPHTINLKSSSGLTLLHCACNGGHEEMVTYLLRNGADIKARDKEGMSPLHHSCLNGHFTVAKTLTEYGVYHSCRDNEGMSPLLYACSEGHTHIVHWLTQIGASLFARNNFGDGALHIASQAGFVELSSWLVARGVNVMIRNKSKKTALELAREAGHKDLVAYLENIQGAPVADEGSDEVEQVLRNKERLEEKLLTESMEASKAQREQAEEADNASVASSVMSIGKESLSSTPGMDSVFRDACAKGDMAAVLKMISLGVKATTCNANGSRPLHFACAGGHIEVVKHLVSIGGGINDCNFKGSSPLHFSCYWKHEELTLWLISQGGDITIKNGEGFTSLHYVCVLGQVSLLRRIIEMKGALPSLSDQTGKAFTPLHCACEHGQDEIVQVLLSSGADVHAVDQNDKTALHYACRSGKLKAAQLLVHHDASINAKDREGYTAILTACLSKQLELLRWLATQGGSLYSANTAGNTCLHLSCKVGAIDLVQWLFERGADIALKNAAGQTAIDVAVQAGHTEVSEWLSSKSYGKSAAAAPSTRPRADSDAHSHENESVASGGQSQLTEDSVEFTNLKSLCMAGDVDAVVQIVKTRDANITNKNGSTVMHFASASGHLKLCRKLVEYGVEHNRANNLGLTPFHCACINGHLALVKWLAGLEGVTLTGTTSDGRTALHHACLNGHTNIVEWLMKSGADPAVLNSDGFTAFHDACYGGHISVVSVLVKYGCVVALRNNAGVSPLHIACEQGHLELVQWLVEEGANPDARDIHGLTPFLNCCEQGHVKVGLWLVSQGVDIHATGGASDGFNTALHLCCQNGHLPMAKWLLDLGLDMDAFNDHNETALQCAMAGRHLELSRWLVAKRFEQFDDITRPEKALGVHEALANEDFPKALILLNDLCHGRGPHIKIPKGSNALHVAAVLGSLPFVQHIMKVRDQHNINAKTAMGQTPLHCAAATGQLQIAICLIEHGAVVDAKDAEGNTALVLAMHMQYSELCQLLFTDNKEAPRVASGNGVAATAKRRSQEEDDTSTTSAFSVFSCIPLPQLPTSAPNSPSLMEAVSSIASQSRAPSRLIAVEMSNEEFDFTGQPFESAMQDACVQGDLTTVRSLVSYGANLNSRNPINASTALHFTCISGNVALAKFLIDNGARLDLKNIGGMTALHIACDRKHGDLAVFLLQQKADCTIRNKAGDSALHSICARGLTEALLTVIQRNGRTDTPVDLDGRTSKGLAPLHCAVDNCQTSISEILIKSKVQANPRDDENRTPLHYACLKGYIDLCELLWSNGGFVNARDTKGRTPLLYACIGGHLALAQWLVKHGADPNATTEVGNNALHAAGRLGNLNMVIWLVEIGVDPYKFNNENVTPAQCAQQAGFLDVVDWLNNDAVVAEAACRRKSEVTKIAME